ncbi:MAG: CapA family protein [Defluviitaleaceae bacterium]|nr:CapA family protein [Defluviitaleaceae bacterium]
MRRLIIMLSMLMALVALAGCGSDQPTDLGEYEYVYNLPNEPETTIPAQTATPAPTTPMPTTAPPTPPTTPEPPPPDPIHIRLQFAGDILLHGGLGAGIGNNRFDYRPFFWAIRPHIDGDLNLVNMETPVDVFGNNHDIRTWPRFNAPFGIVEGLIYAGFNHLITANNHSFDMGFSGLEASLANFERAGIAQTGMYTNADDFYAHSIVDVLGIRVGIIAYTDSFNGLEGIIPSDILPYTVRRFQSHTMNSIPSMAEEIAGIREAGADVVVISLHWGAEYVDQPTNMQRQIARALVDAGADIIMGHHSHTPQPLEWHYREDGNRGLIIYSLGNFLSDQIALGIPATQYGMLVTAHIKMTHNGEITIYCATVLPTLFARDSGRTLGSPYSILPVIGGEAPERVASSYLRAWARRAYNHVVRIVGEEFIYTGGHRE